MSSFHILLSGLLKRIKFANIGYSQEGEDLLIDRILDYKQNGFFIDVGAHHPYLFSNTFRFYLRGWRGINIDAMPGSMTAFNKLRAKDINLEMPVSDKEELLTYYIFDAPALNTLSESEAIKKNEQTKYKIIDRKKLQTRTLESILDAHLPANQAIDFLTVDVEGLDLKVLRSNNWTKYRPNLVLVESLTPKKGIESLLEDETCIYMKSQGYFLSAKTLNTLFFQVD